MTSLENVQNGDRQRGVDNMGHRSIDFDLSQLVLRGDSRSILRMANEPCDNSRKIVIKGFGSARIRDGSRWGLGRARLRGGELSKRLSIERQVLVRDISGVNKHGIEVSKNLKAVIVGVGKVLSRLEGAIVRGVERLGSEVVAKEVGRGLFVGGLRSEAALLSELKS
ncbi:hypothetical protein FOCG_05682 [Fusarium oxysporum f. sp. radicis-lycopersici 26381]|nr:hypothetical protein FOWG_03937 [Fusarium oxysporum f. sp. lycopersici MN25]EXL54916.1 hypothetical protein FOCG_05682 [Fusarium oxysporum f. sp. radicis-lycopersici 26381]